MLIRDFNVVLVAYERMSRYLSIAQSYINFQAYISFASLMDIPLIGG